MNKVNAPRTKKQIKNNTFNADKSDSREALIQDYMDSCSMTRQEAENAADNCLSYDDGMFY